MLFRSFPVHDAGYLLFYMQEPYRREVARVLSRFPDLPVRMFPSPGENFEEALAGCRAVVASAGHQIIAESIRLGKPILVVPRKGQWEQTINARMLEKTGAGAWTTTKDLRRDLPLFLESLRSYSRIPDMPQGFTVNDGIGELERRIRRFLHACSLRGRCPGGKIRRNCGKAAAA